MIRSLISSFISGGVLPTKMSKKKPARANSQRVIKCKGADDFSGFLLIYLFSECSFQIQNSFDLLALKTCLKAHDVAHIVVEAVVQFYIESGIDERSEE